MKNKTIIISILLFLILLIGSLSLYLINNKNNLFDSNLKDYVENLKVPEGFDETQTLIPGFSDISVKKDFNEKGFDLFNPKANNVLFKYTIILEKNNKVLTETKLIPPGKAIEVFPWKGLPTGEYDLIIKINSYSLENPKVELNGANLKIKMRILI